MTILMLVLTALGLAMDAFAVSVSNSMCYPKASSTQRLQTSLTFGVFQGLMPIAGYFAGRVFSNLIGNVDHWVALILLGFIGGKMLIEAIRAVRHPEACPKDQIFTTKTMLVQGLATSIDALAVGVTFAALTVNIWLAAGTIAVITFVCCVFGSLLGRKFGALLGDWAQIFGGLILIGIGIKIFVEHMFFS